MSLYNELAVKQQQLASLQDQLSDLHDKLKDIENNPEQYTDLDSLYSEYLDEIYSDVCEALPVCVSGSQLIAEYDPTMYRCGFSDFCSEYDYSSLDIYSDTESEIEDIEYQIAELQDEISELESEIEDLESDNE